MAGSIIDRIMELEAEKQKLMAQAKDEALKAAQKAVADLNNLGFNYRLIEDADDGFEPASITTTRTRRGGVANDVLATIKNHPDGLTRAGVLEIMGAHDKSAQQSISNALSNLKKKGQLTAVDGVYKAA